MLGILTLTLRVAYNPITFTMSWIHIGRYNVVSPLAKGPNCNPILDCSLAPFINEQQARQVEHKPQAAVLERQKAEP